MQGNNKVWTIHGEKKRKQEKDLKERQDLKETMRIMSHQIKNVNKEIKITKKKIKWEFWS